MYVDSYEKRPPLFSNTTKEEWGNWRWQHQNRLRKEKDFEWLKLSNDEVSGFALNQDFRVAVTPHYAALFDPEDPTCPIRQQAMPNQRESEVAPYELEDPLAEEAHMPVPGITHRYPDRVLFYISHHCPVYCRHCTRKRKVSDPTTAASRSQIDIGLDYIRRTQSVRDILLSGGDPLTFSDEKLEAIFKALRTIPHVEVIRLGTRNPVTLPQRITDNLTRILKENGPIYLHTHFNHVREISTDAIDALEGLRNAGCVLGNQMVLLKGINDSVERVMELNRELLKFGCRPYYMLQCDFAQGISHFRTPIRTGLEIVDALRGRIGGMGIPDFVIDLPGGGGKIELVPNYIDSKEGNTIYFRNYQGEIFPYIDVE